MATETPLESVRAQILREHVEIRARLRGLERLVSSAFHGESRRHLEMSLAHFASAFEKHLSFEERFLAPLVRAVDAWGPAREEAMNDEHREQRKRVEATVALVDVGSVRDKELQGEVRWLVRTLLADMEREEDELAALISLDAGATAQMTG